MELRRLEKIMVGQGSAVREAIEAIDAGAVEIALMVDADGSLLGTISDGDIRRALLRGIKLEDPAEKVLHRRAITAPKDAEPAELLSLMIDHGVEQIPLIQKGRVVDVAFIRDLINPEEREHERSAVIMAGGKGSRLRPLTEEVPKPMLTVGDRPLLETVIDQVRIAGFTKILMAVHYRSEVIEQHFGNGKAFGVDIRYIREDRPLGSAGALQLVRNDLDHPFVVLNADLLTNVNLGLLLRFHQQEANVITVGVRQYVVRVPYGVLDLEGTEVIGLREKPSIELFVNAGIYAVSPEAMELLDPEIQELDMTDLIDRALDDRRRVGSFPVREYWLDVGELQDYERSHDDRATYFTTSR